jgi:hypothetical protein
MLGILEARGAGRQLLEQHALNDALGLEVSPIAALGELGSRVHRQLIGETFDRVAYSVWIVAPEFGEQVLARRGFVMLHERLLVSRPRDERTDAPGRAQSNG